MSLIIFSLDNPQHIQTFDSDSALRLIKGLCELYHWELKEAQGFFEGKEEVSYVVHHAEFEAPYARNVLQDALTCAGQDSYISVDGRGTVRLYSARSHGYSLLGIWTEFKGPGIPLAYTIIDGKKFVASKTPVH